MSKTKDKSYENDTKVDDAETFQSGKTVGAKPGVVLLSFETRVYKIFLCNGYCNKRKSC